MHNYGRFTLYERDQYSTVKIKKNLKLKDFIIDFIMYFQDKIVQEENIIWDITNLWTNCWLQFEGDFSVPV